MPVPEPRFSMVTMMTVGWQRAGWTGWCRLSLSGCCHMTSRTASTFALRSWAVEISPQQVHWEWCVMESMTVGMDQMSYTVVRSHPPTPISPRSCPAGQFSCPSPGGCIEAKQRCDGIPNCPNGEDETGCHYYENITTQSDRPHTPTTAPLRTPSKAAVTHPAVTPTDGVPGYRGICSSSLGLEDGRIRYGQLSSSSYREKQPC
ncbi:hypothetical protein KUCAC02_017424 [Chaenocephalus aceratus]|uniref:Uncharacterized protein n=1 Tax=Chaenocephalus aceratus TaxID=36190 RepID=A0ACB9W236_CHAAC|nr:hypothetical protein KUCAC02_017424 [Chaenocephalus aceratus]